MSSFLSFLVESGVPAAAADAVAAGSMSKTAGMILP
jgi:hypothetical protein